MRVKVRDELGYAGKGRDELCYAGEIAASPSAAPRNDSCSATLVKGREMWDVLWQLPHRNIRIVQLLLFQTGVFTEARKTGFRILGLASPSYCHCEESVFFRRRGNLRLTALHPHRPAIVIARSRCFPATRQSPAHCLGPASFVGRNRCLPERGSSGLGGCIG